MVISNNNVDMGYFPNSSFIHDSINNAVKNFISSIKVSYETKKAAKEKADLEKFVLILSKEFHTVNADIESMQDIVSIYVINDIETDSDVLGDINDLAIRLSPRVEKILDLEWIHELHEPYKTILLESVEELYESLVNLDFITSQKIAQGYLDSTETKDLLEEA